MAEISPYYSDILALFGSDLPWEKISESKILITGSAGLIGSSIVDALLINPRRDYEVYASGRDISHLKKRFYRFNDDSGLHFLKYDVQSPLNSDECFDFIIHAASNASPSSFVNSPVEVMKSNLYGICNLLDYGRSNGMKRLLYISSGEVYGQGDGREFSEDYSGYVNCTLSRSCYPSSNRAAETLCASYKAEYGVDVVIARPCHTYGPYFTESDNRAFAQFIRAILNDEDIIMKSTGEQLRSWCYVVDCVSAILHILLKGKSGEAYNIADPHSSVTIKELASIIANLGEKRIILATPQLMEKQGYNPVTTSVLSSSKIRSLGWAPMTPLKDGLKHSIEEICNNSKV